MTIAWVIGRSGLLGSALSRALVRDRSTLFEYGGRFAWHELNVLKTQIEEATKAFAQVVAGADRWEIYWAAGVGTMMSSEAQFVPETRALGWLLDAIERSRTLLTGRGVFALASSAGAIYAGSREALITEAVPVAPTSAYAHAKLEHEAMVDRFAMECGAAALIARVSTLYGVGQSKAKAQGLVTHISHCIVRNRPIRIFVPLDTIRDYIAADDAAAAMIDESRLASEFKRTDIRIIASEQPATIGEILSIFKRIARRPPRIVTSATSSTGIYTRRIQFRSIAPVRVPSRPRTTLPVGINQVLAAERAFFVTALR